MTSVSPAQQYRTDGNRQPETRGLLRRTVKTRGHQIDHAHSHLELNLILKGRGVYFLDHAHHDLSPGVIVWLLPHQPHRLLPPPDLDMWVVTLHERFCDPELLDDVAAHPHRRLSGEDALALDRLMAHVSQDTDESTLFNAGLDYIMRSARHLAVIGGGPPRKQLHPAVVQAFREMRSAVEPPSAGVLAKTCGVSSDYLGQLLVEQTGRGLVEWRNRIRLERFQSVYPASGDLLTAALDAGFGSYPRFHRVFVELMGMTPGRWARSGGKSLNAVSQWTPETDAASARMIWYPLSAIALPETTRWLGKAFGRALLASIAASGDHMPIDSHALSREDLRLQADHLIQALETTDAVNASRLRRVVARTDLFGQSVFQFREYPGAPELGHLVATYITLAWVAVNRSPMVDLQQLDLLAARTRQALTATGAFDNASAIDRQRAAAAFYAQTIILRDALLGVWNGAGETTRDRVLEAIGDVGQDITGVDLRAEELVFGKAPPVFPSGGHN